MYERRRRARTAETPPPLILVVEDEPGAREALGLLLRDAGYRVELACDGADALDRVEIETPDLVISDVKMPGIDGFQLAQRLSSSHRDDHVPLILVSAFGEPRRRVHGMDVGADDYLVKPIDIDDLLARIRVQLRTANRQRELARRARVDELTQVLNRRGIMKVLAEEMTWAEQSGTPLSVVLVDVNDFKRINDCYGHAVGDVVLRRVAQALVAQVRDSDQVGRLGGDEFLVVVTGEDAESAARMVRRLGDLRDLPSIQAVGIEHEVSVAAGAATALPGDTPDQLIARADLEMFHDKGRH